jgi:hypothetical protein
MGKDLQYVVNRYKRKMIEGEIKKEWTNMDRKKKEPKKCSSTTLKEIFLVIAIYLLLIKLAKRWLVL